MTMTSPASNHYGRDEPDEHISETMTRFYSGWAADRDGDLAEIRTTHADLYPGTDFTVRRPAPRIGRCQWEAFRRYLPTGELRGFVVNLVDDAAHEVMSAEYDRTGHLQEVTKYYVDDSGQISYVFEYDKTGLLVDVFDLLEGHRPAVEPVLASLPDRNFYEDGPSLPRDLVDSPSPDAILRNELSDGEKES